jgi:6-pyruvoyltetrahydropterin/6-carboxytetrahydropterin synthase
MYVLSVDSHFDSSHCLVGYDGECARIHGHTWSVTVSVSTETLGELGYSIDFRDISAVLETILKRFDHKMLNELEEFREINPTAENIARVLFEILADKLNSDDASVSSVTIGEGRDKRVTYSP